MSQILESLRLEVFTRAGGACEYCALSSIGQVGRFPIDHIIPRSRGGLTLLDNLALACPNCNAHKWAHVTGFDDLTAHEWRLFHPRRDSWSDHFAWFATDLLELEGKTPIGRATISRLQINHAEMIAVRRLVAQLRMSP